MKNLKSITILIVLFILANNVFSQCLTAEYPLDGDANDISGNNNNGTVYGAVPTTDNDGNENSAYHFNGIDPKNSNTIFGRIKF